VDFVNRERESGTSVHEAVKSAARTRFRAISLTSLTTFLGLAPIAIFETSLQAQLVVPMAASLAFGILFATVITLFLIPALYLILDDFQQWWKEAWLHAMPDRFKQDEPVSADRETLMTQRPKDI
jgi:multidrug efflux pump subunit AcrB